MSFREFFAHAERFCEDAQEAESQSLGSRVVRCCAASIVFSGIAMEAFINDMMADFAALPEDMFTVHERGFLEERSVEYVTAGGEMGLFRLTSRQDYRALDHKIMFLIAKFGKGTTIDKGSPWWQKFESTKDMRNRIVHPRKDDLVEASIRDARDALEVAQEVIRVVSRAVWGKEAEF